MKWSFRIGSILGIPIKLHVTFLLLLVVVLLTESSFLGTGGIWGVVFICLVFASVVFHELGHSVVARRYGIPVIDITLLPIGGVARMASPPKEPLHEIMIAVAGPVSSLFLAMCLWFLSEAATEINIWDLSIKSNIVAQLCSVNLVLALFNLIPAFPMDGGRVLRGVLGLRLGPLKATKIAVGVGQVFAIALFFLGIWVMNLFMILIALFVYIGAESEERQMGLMLSLDGVNASSVMISDIQSVSPEQTVGEVMERFFRTYQGDFPVVADGWLVGLITRETLTEALHKTGHTVAVETIMARDFPTARETTPLMEILEIMNNAGSKVVAIVGDQRLKGLVTLEQIGRYNMVCSGYSCDFSQPGRG
ncbi:MAG: site-2 protease family protein [Pseudomonadota bacterium]